MLRLLLCDPHQETIASIERLFGHRQAMRLDLSAVDSLEAGTKSARSERPACVLVGSALLAIADRRLLAEQIRAFGRTPVIVLAEPEHATRAARVLTAGAADWVPKGSPLFLLLPRIVGYAVERAQLEAAWRAARARVTELERVLDALLDSAPRPALLLDEDAVIRSLGRPLARLFDRPIGKIEGRRLEDFVDRGSACELLDAQQRALGRPGSEVRSHVRLVSQPGDTPFTLLLCAVEIDEARRRLVAWFDSPAGDAFDSGQGRDPLETAVLEVLARRRQRLPLAQIHLLGLERLREALGERWPELEKQVRAAVERVLRHELDAEERYVPGTEGFLLVFPRLPESRLAARVAAIERAVQAALLGTEVEEARAGEEELLDAERRQQLGEIETAQGTVAVDRADLEGADLWQTLTRRLQRERRAEASERQGLLRELVAAAARSRYETVYDRDGAPAVFSLLVLDEATEQLLARLRQLAKADALAQLDHDSFLLAQHLLALEEEPLTEDSCPIIDLDYETLANRQLRTPYIERLEEVPEALRRSMVFNVCNLPPGTYAPKLAQLLAPLRRFSSMQAIQPRDPRGELPDLGVLRVCLLVVDVSSLGLPPGDPCEPLAELCRRAHRHRVRVLARRVPRGWAPRLRQRCAVDFTCAC